MLSKTVLFLLAFIVTGCGPQFTQAPNPKRPPGAAAAAAEAAVRKERAEATAGPLGLVPITVDYRNIFSFQAPADWNMTRGTPSTPYPYEPIYDQFGNQRLLSEAYEKREAEGSVWHTGIVPGATGLGVSVSLLEHDISNRPIDHGGKVHVWFNWCGMKEVHVAYQKTILTPNMLQAHFLKEDKGVGNEVVSEAQLTVCGREGTKLVMTILGGVHAWGSISRNVNVYVPFDESQHGAGLLVVKATGPDEHVVAMMTQIDAIIASFNLK